MAIGLGLLISVPLFTFAYFNAQSFFARASDEVPRDVTISKITRSSAHVVWVTDKSTQGVVEYGLSSSELNLFAPELESKRDHEVELTLLTAATSYYFHIRVGNTVYDNAGVPWTFTTKTESGDEAEEEVKGISIRLTQAVQKTSPTVTPTPVDCSKMTCTEVKSYLGRGCTTQDLQKCSLAKNDTSTYASPTSGIYISPNPSPTSILIDSNECKMKRLTTPNNNECTTWEWSNIDLNTKICRDSFYAYILHCQNVSCESNVGQNDYEASYVFTYKAKTTTTLPITPIPGKTICCRIKAVDDLGSEESETHSTPWIQEQITCQ